MSANDSTHEATIGTSIETSSPAMDNNYSNSGGRVEHFRMYKRRWLGILVIIAFNIATGLVWLTFNGVSSISESWLNASLTEVNLTVTLYFIGSIATSSVSGYVFEKWGIKYALCIGGALNLIGSAIRYVGSFIESSPEDNAARVVVILIGQFVAACAQPFFLNAPPKYSAVWFDESSRTLATTIGTLANPVGAAIAMVIIPALCTDESRMQFTLLFVAIVALVSVVPAFFIPERPPTPPSPSARIALQTNDQVSFMKSLRSLMKNMNFWKLGICFAVFVALFNSIASLINQMVVPYGYSDDDAGIFGACLVLSGIPGAAISSVYCDKTKKYKLVLKVAVPFLAVGYIALLFVTQEDMFVWICLACAALGFVSFTMLPVALELGVECTYPTPPSTSTFVLWMGGQTLAVLFLQAGDMLRGKSPYSDEPEDTMRTAQICVSVVAVVTSMLALTFNSPYYRLEAERMAQQKEHQIKSDEGDKNESTITSDNIP